MNPLVLFMLVGGGLLLWSWSRQPLASQTGQIAPQQAPSQAGQLMPQPAAATASASTTSASAPINLASFEGQWIWAQPPGADQYHAAMFKVQGGQVFGASWNYYMHETGKQVFTPQGNQVVTDPAAISYLNSRLAGVLG